MAQQSGPHGRRQGKLITISLNGGHAHTEPANALGSLCGFMTGFVAGGTLFSEVK